MQYKYDESILHDLPPEKQMEEMEKWFRSKYENPVENCPCDGGEYVWTYGGPYNALEELSSEFSGLVAHNYIKDLADELEKECWDWSAIPQEDWYDIDYMNDVIRTSDSMAQFFESLDKIKFLSKIYIDDNTLKEALYKMLYANIITSMETYLSETFVKKLFASKNLLHKFLNNNRELNDKKYLLNEIYGKEEFVENEVKEYLARTLWHNIKRVKLFYKIIDISFPEEIEEILKCIDIRHDIIHRNGKTKEGEDRKITIDDVSNLSETILNFIKHIDNQIPKI